MDDQAALDLLLAGLDGKAAGEPRQLSFTTGRRAELWRGNVVALGLSGGFLEPLESTSIHLIQHGIQLLFALFPDRSFAAVEQAEYNRLMGGQIDAIRDFIIAHYHLNRRVGEPFWDDLRHMPIPDTLAAKLALFRNKGQLFRYDDDLFGIPNWTAVLIGQGLLPQGWSALADGMDEDRLLAMLAQYRQACVQRAAGLPDHAAYLQRMIGQASGT